MRLLKLVIVISCLCSVAAVGIAATGLEYETDENTAALWHFNEGQGDSVGDESGNNIPSAVEGTVQWSLNEEWKQAGSTASSFMFDGSTLIAVPSTETVVQPADALTVEAWVYPENLDGWKLICTHWGGAVVGTYHLGVENGVPKLHINTDQGVGFASAVDPLLVQEWQHVAGTYDGATIKLYVDGVEVGAADHTGVLTTGDPEHDVVIGSKASREFNWNGLLDEVRISSVAREAAELSPNLTAPPSPVEPNANTLSGIWGQIKDIH